MASAPSRSSPSVASEDDPVDGSLNGKDGEEVLVPESDSREPVAKKRRGPNGEREWRELDRAILQSLW